MPKCEKCGKEAELKEYKIVDELGTRYRNLCPECSNELKEGKPLTTNESSDNEGASTTKPIRIGQAKEANASQYSIGLYITGVLFLLAAVVFYAISVNNEYGVANIQATTFAGANFVAAIVSFTGGTIIKALKK